MKFYYKDQLIRTSKTHAYNWAILTERPDGTYACHGCRVFLSTLSLRRATAKVHKTVGHFCAYGTNFMGIASSC